MKTKLSYARSPTLETVQMVEETIKNSKEDFTRRSLWKALPRQVMWQTYLAVLEYLASILHIGFDHEGHIIYLHNPKLMERVRHMKDYGELAVRGKIPKRKA